MFGVFKLKNAVRACCMQAVGLSACVAPAFELQDLAALGLSADDIAEVMPLAMEALVISHRAAEREAKRNEGELEDNVRAAIMYLSRKGFGQSGRPAKDRPAGFFDCWKDALRRYNGRRDRTDTDRYYSDEYAEKILRRAEDRTCSCRLRSRSRRRPQGAESM